MKKIILFLTTMFMTISLSACSSNTVVTDVLEQQTNQTSQEQTTENSKVNLEKADDSYDVDLSEMNTTMMYSQVTDMMTNPDNYLGKKVKMKGTFVVSEWYDNRYYSIVVEDATLCCVTQMEFILGDNKKYPEDYPTPNTEITIDGYFNTYAEVSPEDGLEYMYVNLINARVLED